MAFKTSYMLGYCFQELFHKMYVGYFNLIGYIININSIVNSGEIWSSWAGEMGKVFRIKWPGKANCCSEIVGGWVV